MQLRYSTPEPQTEVFNLSTSPMHLSTISRRHYTWEHRPRGCVSSGDQTGKGVPMSYRAIASLAAVAILGIACISTEALAYRGGVRAGGARVAGVHGVYRGGAYRGAYVRRGVGVGVGAAAVGLTGAAIATGAYYGNSPSLLRSRLLRRRLPSWWRTVRWLRTVRSSVLLTTTTAHRCGVEYDERDAGRHGVATAFQ